MVASGWGALFVIYPSLPRNDDLNVLLAAAEAAWDEKRGAWAEFGEDLLLG
jgi:endonuclease YncB( thermonuclease family)